MKKFIPLSFFSFILLLGCTSSTEETSNSLLTNTGLHIVPNHGSKNIPISVFDEGGSYHLIYSTGSKEWGHLVSPNMIHWSFDHSFEVPTSEVGDVVSAELSGDTTNTWIMFYDQEGVKARVSTDRNEWQCFDLTSDTEMRGIPKINEGFDGDWIMTITNDQNISFYHSSDLRVWSKYNALTNKYSASYAEVAIIENKPFLMIDGYAGYLAMRFEGEQLMTISDLSMLPNAAAGTYFQADGIKAVIYALESKLFSTPLEVEVNENNTLRLAPSEFLKNQTLVKRRGRLSRLIGDNMCTIFSFKIDSIASTSKVILSNETGDQVEIGVVRDGNTFQIEFEGKSFEFEEPSGDPSLRIDLIVDHNYVGLFANGFTHVGAIIHSAPLFNKVSVAVDGVEVNPRSIVYTISDVPN